jgi:hypothetical protein
MDLKITISLQFFCFLFFFLPINVGSVQETRDRNLAHTACVRKPTRSKVLANWSEMATNYWMIVERYPKPNGVHGGSQLGREIFSLLDKKPSQVVMHLMGSKKKKKKKKKRRKRKY